MKSITLSAFLALFLTLQVNFSCASNDYLIREKELYERVNREVRSFAISIEEKRNECELDCLKRKKEDELIFGVSNKNQSSQISSSKKRKLTQVIAQSEESGSSSLDLLVGVAISQLEREGAQGERSPLSQNNLSKQI